MSEIIENDNNSVVESDGMGKGLNNGLTLKVYQDIYHQITGRTERIQQRYSNNLLIDFEAIEQMHFKIMQLCDVHTVVASNEVVTVYHEKERKEQFTSFTRFKAYNTNATKPTVNIALRYNFSIQLSDLSKPQEYVVTIKLTSRVAVLNQLESEMPAFMRGRFVGVSSPFVAEISVEYADYIIALSFLESFDEWVDGCKSIPDNFMLDIVQGLSHYIPRLTQLSLASVFMCFCLISIPDYFQQGGQPEVWARFIAIFGIGFYLLITVGSAVGRIIEHSIDSITQLSYLKLNKGDEKLISNFSSKNKRNFLKFSIACVVTIVLGVVSSKLSLLV